MTSPRTLLCSLLFAAGCTFDPGALPDPSGGGVGGGGNPTGDGGVAPGDDGAPPLAARLTLSQTAIDFGDVLVGKASAPQLLTVTNSGAQPSGVPTLSLDGPGAAHFSVSSDCTALEAGASCHLTVVFKPTLALSANALVGASASPGNAVSAALSGHGLSPDHLVITPPSYDFGHATVGGSGTDRVFTVKNSGSVTAPSLPAAQLGGAQPNGFSLLSDGCKGTTLAAGKSCTVDVQFTPDHGGAVAATLEVGLLASTLSGTGDGHGWATEIPGSAARLTSVWGGGGRVYVVGASGLILRSSGDGAWSSVASATTNLLWWVTGSGADVYAFGNNGTIAHASSGGAFALDPTPAAAQSLYGGWAGGSTAVAVGGAGQIWRYTPSAAGGAWQQDTSNTTSVLNAVWGTSTSNLYAVGGGGVIVHFTNGAWNAETNLNTQSLRGVWGSSASSVIAVGRGGTILRSVTLGVWVPMVSPTTKDLWSVWGASANDVYAVGDGGTLLHYDGLGWSTVSISATTDLFGVWGTSGSDVYVVGDVGTLLHYQ